MFRQAELNPPGHQPQKEAGQQPEWQNRPDIQLHPEFLWKSFLVAFQSPRYP